MTVRIVEIISRSEQGITRPFLCRGEDGRQYFVKGGGAGRRALISEWLAGQIGLHLGLPIPNFQQMIISREIVEFSAREDIQELGAGTGFGSQLVENTDELAYLFIEQIDPKLRAKVLLYDWWVHNGDRTLSAEGGNPNLLWVHHDHRLYVIDHNLAFSEDDYFWDQHIFRESRAMWTQEFIAEMEPVMGTALGQLAQWWGELPDEWLEVDTGLTLEVVRRLLSRYEDSSGIFWRAT